MTAPTATQPLSSDDLIADLATNLKQLGAISERITPFTVIEYTRHAGLPAIGYTDAYNALRDLHDAGLLHQTHRTAVYALRADLPTAGTGHVWFRVNNRASAPIEVVGDKPRPKVGLRSDDLDTRWTCHGCAESDISSWYPGAVEDAQKHAEECRGQHLDT